MSLNIEMVNKALMLLGSEPVAVSFLQRKGFSLFEIDEMVVEGYLAYYDGKKKVYKTNKGREVF